jgi:hemoglobin-like flavoprotein
MNSSNAARIRACLTELYPRRREFAARFYERFFEQAPQVRRLFVHDTDKQQLMLYAAIAMSMRALESARMLDEELVEFGSRHARVGVKEEHFPIFGSVFLETLIEFLPHHDHPDLARSWWGAFTDISTAIIAGLRAEAAVMSAERKLFAAEAEDSPVVILGRRMENRFRGNRLH